MRSAWKLKARVDSTFQELCEFLEEYAHSAPPAPVKRSPVPPSFSPPWCRKEVAPRDRQTSFPIDARGSCVSCGAIPAHPLYLCPIYRNLDANGRLRAVRQYRHCENCLAPGHSVPDCRSRGCQVYRSKHHSTLHDALQSASAHMVLSQSGSVPANTRDYVRDSGTRDIAGGEYGESSETIDLLNSTFRHEVVDVSDNSASDARPLVAVSHAAVSDGKTLDASFPLLATAIVQVASFSGAPVSARALIDPASQLTLISFALARRLGLHIRPTRGAIGLAAAQEAFVRGEADVSLYSACGEFVCAVVTRVVNVVTGSLPGTGFDLVSEGWSYLRGMLLADPWFNRPAPVDLLLDAAVFADVVGSEVWRGPEGYPVVIQSLLGTLLFGRCPAVGFVPHVHAIDSVTAVHQVLERFWTLDSCGEGSSDGNDDGQLAERHFVGTHHRTSEGRFVVRLPFKPGMSGLELGLSRFQAARRFANLKSRKLTPDYRAFMTECISLGHMFQRLPSTTPRYYIPHHPVFRAGKLRVVFDASARTSSGLSLNDLLLVGPTIQPDLFQILVNFRSYSIALKADIVKMYRQVLMDPRDRVFRQFCGTTGLVASLSFLSQQ